ncbi:MAG TPA: NUDIX domain-containing protein [Anaerolineales bacterium]|nr:NUDIX domain-containing protein [Anaerolineales bacterium]
MTKQIEFIARLVLVSGDHILLTQKHARGYSYLPGGHIEFGESAADALNRELQEEIGGRARVGAFLGALEQSFSARGKFHHEINLVFWGVLEEIAYPEQPTVLEDDLAYIWQPLNRLQEANFQPPAMIPLVLNALAEDQAQVAPYYSIMED